MLSLRWPDARFRLCQACVPLELIDAAEPYRDQTDAGQLSDLRRPHQSEQPSAAPVLVHAPGAALSPSLLERPAAAPAAAPGAGSERHRGASQRAGQRSASSPPAAASSAMDSTVERQVLLAAARTVLTSRPAPRGRRLGRDGSCDVVAALTLAAGGAVDETGQPTAPTECAAAKLLGRVLQHLADLLAGCAPGRSWNGDAVELIDAWQAGPAATGQTAAALLGGLAQQTDPAAAAGQQLEPAAAPRASVRPGDRRGAGESVRSGAPARTGAGART